ncbi:hypothetical protein ABVK25_012267 [Lepraria finkii]|uniref:Uncharacterized protein n=1 Tax=Lepraria finkii TaxID=1340010 RepID=A0ABR4AMG4_9LECA
MRDQIARLEDFEKSATAELDRRIRESEESSKQQLVEANKQIKRLENASLEHEQHLRSTVQKHRKDLEERNMGHEQELKEVPG